mgnify:CR=1 FL=1
MGGFLSILNLKKQSNNVDSQIEFRFEEAATLELATVASSAIHEPEEPRPIIRVQPYQPGRSDRRFKQRIKESRGHQCEQCGRRLPGQSLHVHHILLTSIYPQFAREDGNVLILCSACHSAVSRSETEGASFRAYFYSTLPYAIRMQHLPFLESTGFASEALALLAASIWTQADYWNDQPTSDYTRQPCVGTLQGTLNRIPWTSEPLFHSYTCGTKGSFRDTLALAAISEFAVDYNCWHSLDVVSLCPFSRGLVPHIEHFNFAR